PIVVDVMVVVLFKTEMEDEDLQVITIKARHEVNLEVFLNEKHLTPKLKNLNEESNTSKVWYLDNGASNHMTGDRDKFSDIDRSVQGTWRYDTDKWGTFMGSRQEWKIAHEVDDFSRVMWVYMLKSKDEALGMFQKFCVLVENETSVKVKTLRSDRGGEFNSKAFTEYCNDTGLKHHFTAPYSPQQNGVVERRNRLVIEMTRSMMKSMEVPDTLWGEAKLDSRSEMLVHLGTETGSKAYRLLDPVSGRIRVSRDVRFDKGKQWLWGETTKFKESPRSTFTIEGYSKEDTNLEDENDSTDEPLESFEGINITTQEFSSYAKTYFTIITIIQGNFSLYYITCIVNILVCHK
ncbi:zinc finger, CCHC-type containing protein, partial [Tanacetum coccineum]